MDHRKGRGLEWIRRLLLPLAGFGALLWFLIRVVPKPSRARYPCMRAAAPLASSFVIGILSLGASSLLLRKARSFIHRSRYALFGACLAAGLCLGALSLVVGAIPAGAASATNLRFATKLPSDGPNMPMGKGVGIFPGRVVWVHDSSAVNQRYSNGGILSGLDKPWFDEANANQEAVDAMLAKGIRSLAGTEDVGSAWDKLFRDLNKRRGLGDRGYRRGESIVVKINLNGMGNGPKNINTSPQVIHALLSQLMVEAKIPQEMISLGDPNIPFDYYPAMYRTVLRDFPKLRIMQRGATPGTASDLLFASDGGTSDPLPQAYADAAYLINVPVLKKHHRAGISLAAKLHFGSIAPYNGNGAFNWHYGLPAPDGTGLVSNGDYGVYRCLVDFMGHRDLGGKTVLYLVDGLWSSINWGHPAIKWRMGPFNGEYPASLLLSQDPVAVDSVGYDFLYAEFDEKHPKEGAFDPRDDHGPFARYAGVDDYLHQAADKAYWPKGLVYDPERDGKPIGSLGVHEHWNDAAHKKYSRNLGKSAGIELVYLPAGGASGATGAPGAVGAPVTAGAAETASVAEPEAGKVYGEFEDAKLLSASMESRPDLRSWSEKEVWDGLSGATIQAKTFGKPVPDRTVLCRGKVIAYADGFGQYWLSLPAGSYELVGRCKGYRDEKRTVVVEAGSVQYLNFRLERR
jgi:hypothetical protein